MIDWSWVDWDMVIAIAGTTWGITILVTAIAWLVAWMLTLVLRRVTKTQKSPPESK